MAQFDQNVWYNIRFNSSTGNALQSSGHYFFATGGPYGSAFISPYNNTPPNAAFNWQFFPSPQNSSRYILRPANSRTPVWLTAVQQAVFGNCDDDCSSTAVSVTNVTGSNAIWSVIPSGDGISSFLSNSDNGTSWRIAVDTTGAAPGSWLNMADADGGNTKQMHWQFSSVAKINDQSFSTLAPGFTATSPSNSSSTSAPRPTSTHKKSSSHVGAAVGGAVGGLVVLVLLITSALFFWRRRRRNQGGKHESLPQYEGPGGESLDRKEDLYGVNGSTGNAPVEAPYDNQILEAPRDQDTGMGAEAINKGDVSELPGHEARESGGRIVK